METVFHVVLIDYQNVLICVFLYGTQRPLHARWALNQESNFLVWQHLLLNSEIKRYDDK